MASLGTALGTFIITGTLCLAAGDNCFTHTLPAAPDWVGWIGVAAAGTDTCAPVNLISRSSTMVLLRKAAGSAGLAGDVFAPVLHSVIR